MRKTFATLCALAACCGPSDASPSDDGAASGSSGTGPQDSSTTEEPALDGTTNVDEGHGASTSAGSSDDTTTGTAFGGWGDPELIAELETRGAPGLYPEVLITAGSFIFASTSQGITTWRVDPRTLEVDTVELVGGIRLAATDSSLYVAAPEGFLPCCARVGLETLESVVVAGSGQLAGSHAGGIAMFGVVDTPRPRTGVVSWLEEGDDSDIDVFAAPELRRIFGVSSAGIVVQLADSVAVIELGSWTAATVVESVGDLDAVSWSEVSDDFVYLATDSDTRVIALDGSLDTTLGLAVVTPEADAVRLVWVDSRDATRVWSAATDGSGVEPVVEADVPVWELALGVDALYWLSSMGRIYRLPYPT